MYITKYSLTWSHSQVIGSHKGDKHPDKYITYVSRMTCRKIVFFFEHLRFGEATTAADESVVNAIN